jgi:hypothetical protein
VGTGVNGLVAVGATVTTGVDVASATTLGEGVGARNLVYTTRPAMATRPIISKPTRPTTTIMNSLLCPPLGLAIFSLPSKQKNDAPSLPGMTPLSTLHTAHRPCANWDQPHYV